MKYNFIIVNDLIHVNDSYLVNSRKEINEFLLKQKEQHSDYAIFNRSIKGMVNEWMVHNLCYKLHIFRSHTRDVDLEYPQKWYFKIAYNIIGSLL